MSSDDRGPDRAAPRPCSILDSRSYSLREASEASGVPEEQLRRAILLDDLPGTLVPDDRQYLLEGRILQDYVRSIRPREESRFEGDDPIGRWTLGMFMFFPMILFIGLSSLAMRAPAADHAGAAPIEVCRRAL